MLTPIEFEMNTINTNSQAAGVKKRDSTEPGALRSLQLSRSGSG